MLFVFLITTLIFSPHKNEIVLPHTGIEKVQNTCTGNGLLVALDNEWAYYHKIGPNVFVRRTLKNTLFCDDTLIHQTFKYDLNGDGKFEKISFKNNTLKITDYRGRKATYKNVSSFVFYDFDNNGSLDLIYTDTDGILHSLKNTKSNKNFAIIKSKDTFLIEYFSRKKLYRITVYPSLVQSIIPLTGWDKIVLKYKNSSMELSKGMVVNTEKLLSPIEQVTYINDTLKISLNLSNKATYTIYVIGKDTLKVANGTLPKGVYRFEYYIGPLKKGTYKVKLTLDKKDFFTDFKVK